MSVSSKTVLLGLILSFGGCGPTISPADQFKALSDSKKNQLERLAASKNSKIWGYEATVTPVTNVDEMGQWTHNGKIVFSYGTSRTKGFKDEFEGEGVEVKYRRPKNGEKWVREACWLTTSGKSPHGEVPLMRYEDVARVFEDKQK